jgi:hypothetical protein
MIAERFPGYRPAAEDLARLTGGTRGQSWTLR